jgi:ATP-dependent DNA ligase
MLRPRPLPPGFIAPCLPVPAERRKNGPDWVHEIKHDGYRMIARRTGDRIRLYTRRGFNWADRYPTIVAALRSLRVRSIVIDGEAVICGTYGKSDFGKLHSGVHDASVFLYAFDLIELDARTLRPACKLGLEGIVSKRRDLPYRSGRCRAWVKIKNPASPAVLRIQDGTW